MTQRNMLSKPPPEQKSANVDNGSSVQEKTNELFQAASSSGSSAISLPDNSHRYVQADGGKVETSTVTDYQNQRNAQSQQYKVQK